MLHQFRQVGGPNVWQNLLAFYVSVETGSLATVVLVWSIVLAQRVLPDFVWNASRAAIATADSILAMPSVFERAQAVPWIIGFKTRSLLDPASRP